MAAEALCRTYLAFLRLGCEVIEGPGCVAVRDDASPLVYDANHVQVAGEADVDRVLDFLEQTLGDRAHRQIATTPRTTPALEARLVLEGYAPTTTWQGLLTARLEGPMPRDVRILRVETDAAWRDLDRLVRVDHVEEGRRAGRPPIAASYTAQRQALRRRIAPAVRFFLAYAEADPGEAVAFFSAWPGVGGVGMVEDLFTHPDHRGRGYARALIHRCVEDARARGARSVLIGAEPDDTPKALYARLGFAPTCLTRTWLREPEHTPAS